MSLVIVCISRIIIESYKKKCQYKHFTMTLNISFFFKNLINYEKKREEKLKIKNIQDSNGKFSLHYKSSCFKNHT